MAFLLTGISRVWVHPGRQSVREGRDEFIAAVELDLMRVGKDFRPDIGIDEGLRNGERLSKDVQLLVTADETDEGNGSVRDFRADLG